MAEFRYEATNRDGVPQTGFLSAGTIRQAMDELSERGLNVRRVEPVRENEEAQEVTEFLAPLSGSAATNVAELLSDAVRTELPLEPALRAAAEDAPRAERHVLNDIADHIAAGMPPAEAFLKAGDALPSHLLALILAGLERGDLARLLSRYLTLSRQRAEARRPLWIGLAYPLVLLAGVCTALLFIFIVIVPQFETIFDDFGSNLPAITVFVIQISHFVRSFWWPVLAASLFFGLMFAIYWFLMRRRGLALTSLPILDLFVRASDWGRFCGLLGLLVEGRQPLPQALRLAGASATSLRVRNSGLAMADDVEAGLTPWEAALPRTIPKPIRHVFRWANRQDVFAEALAGLAEIYARRARVWAGLLGVLVEPLVLIFMAFTLGLVVLALFMPLIQLLNDLS